MMVNSSCDSGCSGSYQYPLNQSSEKKTVFFRRRVITTSSTGMGQSIGSVHEFGPRWSTVIRKDPSFFGTRRGAEAQRELGLT